MWFIWIKKNLYPNPNNSLIYDLLMVFIDGAIILNLFEYKMKLAIMITNIGNTDIVHANATREGGQNFVNRKIAINERKFPKTGKAEDKATF